jgi:hypothetical protein
VGGVHPRESVFNQRTRCPDLVEEIRRWGCFDVEFASGPRWSWVRDLQARRHGVADVVPTARTAAVTDSHPGMAVEGLEDQAGGGALRLACAGSKIGLSQVRHQDWPAQEPEGLGDAGDCVQTQSRPTGAPGSHAQRRRDAAAGSVE